MPDYLALKAEIAKPAYAAMTDAQIVAALLTNTVNSFVDVQWSDLKMILMSNGAWGTVVYTERRASGAFLGGGAFATATQVMAIEFADCCRFGGVLKTSVAAVRTRMSTRLNTLAGATVGAISAASQTEMIALATKTQTVGASIGWPIVYEADLIAARAM